MGRVVPLILIFLFLTTGAFAEVLFTEGDRTSLDFIVDTTTYRSGFSVGGAWGLNDRWQADLNYLSANDGGVNVSLIVPGYKCYLLKPNERSNWSFSAYNRYLFGTASTGSQGVAALGYIVGAELGYDVRAWQGYRVLPYLGLLYNSYKLDGSSYYGTYPKAGLYFGIPMGGGAVGYLKQVLTKIDNEVRYSATIGYHFLIGR